MQHPRRPSPSGRIAPTRRHCSDRRPRARRSLARRPVVDPEPERRDERGRHARGAPAMTVSLAPRVTTKRSAGGLEGLAERGNIALVSLTDHEAAPAEVVAWVAETFGTDAAAVACSMADAAF